jgi:hypothetical protein
MDIRERHVLQKRGDEAVVIRADFSSFALPNLQILSGRQQLAHTPSPADELAALMGYPAQARG